MRAPRLMLIADLGSERTGYACSPHGKRRAYAVDNDGAARYKPLRGRAISVINAGGTGLVTSIRTSSWGSAR
jgi:hypothetical protein